MSMANDLQVYCPPLLPRAVHVVQAQPWPQAARLGSPAVDRGPLVRSIRAAAAGATQ